MATTKDTPETTLAPVESLSYEQACRELIETVRMLEAGNTGLEEALTLWERGEELAGHCQAFLDRAQQRISARVDHQEDAEPEASDTDQ